MDSSIPANPATHMDEERVPPLSSAPRALRFSAPGRLAEPGAHTDGNESPRHFETPYPLRRSPPPRPKRMSMTSRCCGNSKATKRFLHMVWLDIVSILVLLGITGAVLKWAPVLLQADRIFPIHYVEGYWQGEPGKGGSSARFVAGHWEGPRELSYPSYHPPHKNITLRGGLGMDTPDFIVPVVPLSVALPLALGAMLMIMQLWVRSGWDKAAALLGLYKVRFDFSSYFRVGE